MKNKNQLMSLNRMELMGNLKHLVKKEKELTLEILDYLQEISNRKLFLEMGYPTLFAFLTEELGYCSGTAYLRIQTMRALEVPENRERVLNDKTSLSSLAKTQSFINNENKELGKQSESLLTEKEKKELFAATEGVPANKVEEVLKEKKHEMEVKKSEEKGLPPPVKKPLKKFTFEADQELVGMIDELKSLLSHACPRGELTEVLQKALPLSIQEIKIKKGLVKRSETKQAEMGKDRYQHNEKSDECVSSMKSRSVETQADNLTKHFHHANGDSQQLKEKQNNKFIKNEQVIQNLHNKSWGRKRQITRSIPVELKRKVWRRDSGCCQYRDPQTGKKCGSKHQLEFEHVKPWSLGGEHSLENLWTLCRNHNLYRWDSIANK